MSLLIAITLDVWSGMAPNRAVGVAVGSPWAALSARRTLSASSAKTRPDATVSRVSQTPSVLKRALGSTPGGRAGAPGAESRGSMAMAQSFAVSRVGAGPPGAPPVRTPPTAAM
ncbi:hypothetical protein [Corallococcus sp. M7]